MCRTLPALCGPPRKQALFYALAVLTLLLLLPAASQAATPGYLPYPSNDSTVINPYGAKDETALLLGALLGPYQTATGKQLNIRTRTGRGGATGWGDLVSQPGDGYYLAATNLQNLVLRSMSRYPVFALSDVYNVCVMAEAPLVLWVPENSPFTTLKELAASARAYPEKLIIAGTGSLTIDHLATLQFNFLSGSQTIYLPYLGTTTAMQAVAIGQAHAAWGYALPHFGPQMGMRPLAVAAPVRQEQMPDVPTFDEMGIELFVSCHFGLALPASTPAGTRQEVAKVMEGIIASPAFDSAVRKLGFSPQTISGDLLNKMVGEMVVNLGKLADTYPME